MPFANLAHVERIGNLTLKSTDSQIRRNAEIRKEYGALLDRYPSHPVVVDGRGTGLVVRWKRNDVVVVMIDKYVDLNSLWIDFTKGNMPIEDMATVYRLMGYSLCGFIEVFGDHIEGI